VVKLLAHPVNVSSLDHLFEVSDDGYCHGFILRSLPLLSL
jgi:hypothetical protein